MSDYHEGLEEGIKIGKAEAATRIAELESALNEITARLLETFPGLKDLPPIQKARAALTGGKEKLTPKEALAELNREQKRLNLDD